MDSFVFVAGMCLATRDSRNGVAHLYSPVLVWSPELDTSINSINAISHLQIFPARNLIFSSSRTRHLYSPSISISFFSLSDIMDLRHQIKCHVFHHVGGKRHTPVVCNESREPHTSHYPSRLVEIFLKLQ